MMVRPTADNRKSTAANRRVLLAVRYLWSVVRRPWLLIMGLFLLALLPRMLWLDQQSLWLDEGSTWQLIQHSWGNLLIDMANPVSGYPLYHLLLKGWVALFGDSEWALRLPSALTGAGAVVAIYFTAREFQLRDRLPQQHPTTFRPYLFPLTTALLLLTSPFALWYAQEAKVYSLLLFVATLVLWRLLRALHTHTRRDWFILGVIALLSVFVHRLAILILIAAWASYLLVNAHRSAARLTRTPNSTGRNGIWSAVWQRWTTLPAQWTLLALASSGIIAGMVFSLGETQCVTGACIPADPPRALWLTFVRFSVDRWPGDAPWWWLLPWVGLALWGFGLGIADWRLRRKPTSSHLQDTSATTGLDPTSRIVVLCFLIVPLALFLIQLAFTRVYEARYLIVIYPAWVLALAYPVTTGQRHAQTQRQGDKDISRQSLRRLVAPFACCALLIVAVTTNIAVLLQPTQGLFSGDPVKEQYREIVQELAQRVHPDDLVVVHPSYLRPLYDYYMHRLTADPPPEPVAFGAFKRGQTTFTREDWDAQRQRAFAGYLRSFLLIAPEHARTVDVPNREANDIYGRVGLYFQFSREQQKWPCGIWERVGVDLLCQDSPEAYETGEVPQPATELQVQFGEQLLLQGYTLKATMPEGLGVYRAGGTLPITLFWDVPRTPTENYSIFLHLCRECDIPPAASTDGEPLEGYLPTSVWLPNKPVHDERAIPLPRDLPPGQYTLLLGVYRPGDQSPDARLAVQGEQALENNRLVIGTIEVVAPE